MGAAEFSLLLAGLQLGGQALAAFNQARSEGKLTADQAAAAQVFVDRISAAQALVTPYQKEPTNG